MKKLAMVFCFLLLVGNGWAQSLADPRNIPIRDRPALSPHSKPDYQFSIKVPKNLRTLPVIQPKPKEQKPAEEKTTENGS